MSDTPNSANEHSLPSELVRHFLVDVRFAVLDSIEKAHRDTVQHKFHPLDPLAEELLPIKAELIPHFQAFISQLFPIRRAMSQKLQNQLHQTALHLRSRKSNSVTQSDCTIDEQRLLSDLALQGHFLPILLPVFVKLLSSSEIQKSGPPNWYIEFFSIPTFICCYRATFRSIYFGGGHIGMALEAFAPYVAFATAKTLNNLIQNHLSLELMDTIGPEKFSTPELQQKHVHCPKH